MRLPCSRRKHRYQQMNW